MSRLLKVNQSDIKRAIDENRLDWISAIYHLLMRDKEQHAAAKVSNVSCLYDKLSYQMCTCHHTRLWYSISISKYGASFTMVHTEAIFMKLD